MSHFTVLVIGDVEENLAPFHEYECTGIEDEYVVFVETERDIEKEYKKHKKDYSTIEDFARDYYGYHQNEEGKWGRMTNPNAKWDWWSVGGRWSGSFFLLKHGATGAIIGESSVFGNKTGIDGVQLKFIDWEAMKEREEKKAKEYWESIEAAFGGVIPQPEVSWAEFIDENGKYKDMPIDEKRRLYHEQPALVKLEEARKEYSSLFGYFFELEAFAGKKEDYIRRRGEPADKLHSVVVNKTWYQKGEMGWFGMSFGDKEDDEWIKEFNEIISKCNEDDYATLVDCHI